MARQGVIGLLSRNEVEVVQAEIDRQHIQRSLLRIAVNNTKTPEDYEMLTIKARGDHGWYTRHHGLMYTVVWGLIGLTCLMVSEAYDYLSRWNRGIE